MKKTLILIFTIMMLSIAILSMGAICYAEETETTENEQVVEQPVIVENSAQNEVVVWFKNVYARGKNAILGAIGGISGSAVLGAILLVIVKRITNKAADTVEQVGDAKTIADTTTKMMLEKWSNVALDVNIKPLMESQYKEMAEQIMANFTIELEKSNAKNEALLDCIDKLGSYFDCSVAVSDEAKEEFHKAIEDAKAEYKSDTKVTAKIEVVAEPTKETKKTVVENY